MQWQISIFEQRLTLINATQQNTVEGTDSIVIMNVDRRNHSKRIYGPPYHLIALLTST
jgi:hypothetical protein